MADSVKDMVVRLTFEHGDTKAQISAIRNELKMLDQGFAATAAAAGNTSGAMNQAGASVDLLNQKIALQQQAVQALAQATTAANQKLTGSVQAHERTGQALEQLKAKQEELKTSISDVKAAMEAEAQASGTNSARYQELAAQLQTLEQEQARNAQEIQNTEQAYARQERTITRNAQALQRAQMAEQQGRAELQNLNTQLDQANTRLTMHAERWTAAATALRAYGTTAVTAGQAQVAMGRTMSRVTTAIVAAGAASVGAAVSWESSWAGVQKTVHGTEEQMAQLEQDLLNMENPTSFADLAQIAANAGQLGVATENVSKFTKTMADLAEVSNLSTEEAAQSFAQYANITGMSQENFDRLGSSVVAVGNNLATTESDIVNFALRIAAAGRQAGLTDQEIVGFAGGFASLGLEAQAGGTAFSKALSRMQVAAEAGGEDLDAFSKVCGMTGEQFQSAFKADAAGTFLKFIEGLSTGSDSAIVMLTELGITEARMRDTLLRASNAGALFTQSMNLSNEAWAKNTELADKAAIRYNTTEARMAMLGKEAQKTAMSFGQAILPYVEQGMAGIQSLIDKFNALDSTQQANIIKWGAMVAAIGPVLTIIGKANIGIGKVSTALSTFATTMANASSVGAGLATGLTQLLGPAGIAAVAIAAAAGAYAFLDWASGAKAAREATAELGEEAQRWMTTTAQTIYDTGTGDVLARFGLTKEAFTGAEESAAEWVSSLIATWTDGEKETDEIVKSYVDGWVKGSDEIREGIDAQRQLLEGLGVLSPETQAHMRDAETQLTQWDKEIGTLLKKRQNGFLTEEETSRLNELIQLRGQVQLEFAGPSSDGYSEIVAGMHAAVERMSQTGEIDSTVFGDTLSALAEGRSAYIDALDASYDAQYKSIAAIQDETTRMEALKALNAQYQQQRQQGETEYSTAVQEAGKAAWEANKDEFQGQMDTLYQLAAAMGDVENIDLPTISSIAEGLDEGQLTSMIALIQQMQSTEGGSDALAEMGVDAEGLLGVLEQIRDVSGQVEGLEGLNEMVGTALPEELQRIMVGLDMTQAEADWAAFMEGKDVFTATGTVEIDAETAISQWQAANAGKEIDAGTVKMKAELEGDWMSLLNSEKTTFYDSRGNVIEMTPEAAGEKLTREDFIVGQDADGNYHVTFQPDPPAMTVSITLDTIDRAQISAWEAANRDVEITGPKAKVGVALGNNWAAELRTAYDQGMLEVYGSDGAKIPVTPEVVASLGPDDLVLTDADGTVHVIITPELGSTESLEITEDMITAKPLDNTPFEFMSFITDSTQDKIDKVNSATASVEQFSAAIEDAKQSGQDTAGLESGLTQNIQNVSKAVGELDDGDLESIGARMQDLMAALNSGTGSPEEIESWKSELESLQGVVDAIDPDRFTSTGENCMAGIAKGMSAYSFSGDAGSIKDGIKSAIDGALGIASPSTVMMPTGEFVSAGIAQGMSRFSFSAAASSVANNMTGPFGSIGSRGRTIGANFGQGIYNGLAAKKGSILALANSIASQVTARIQRAWDEHSPSKKAIWLAEMFGEGLKIGMRDWPTVSERVLEDDVLAAGRGMRSVSTVTNDSRNESININIPIDNMNVRSDNDIKAISAQIAGLIRKQNRARGRQS